jgi:hypothetical protein
MDEKDNKKIISTSLPKYTLWTAPREAWLSPVAASSLPDDAEDKLEVMKPVNNDQQTAPFRTPVTPDVLEVTVR